ncbi:MAG: ATPase [Candidatus Omnitrophota bacterium]|jgi:uncharacterized protein
MSEDQINKIQDLLRQIGPSLVACSGGLDSLVLAVLEHRLFPAHALIAHGVSPAVPREANARVRECAAKEGWRVEWVESGELQNEAYLQNPLNRCFHCKTHLYGVLREFGYDPKTGRYGRAGDSAFRRSIETFKPYPILSGANTDDLGEYRPGLDAAREAGVRHPWIEAGIGKEGIRAVCRLLELPFSELPASPCLASRIYTGTRVERQWLSLIDSVESELKERTGVRVVRCRLKEKSLWIETTKEEQQKLTMGVVEEIRERILAANPELESLALDPAPYQPGRAFVKSL